MSTKFKPGDKVVATKYRDCEYWNNGKLEVTYCGAEFVHARTPDGKTGAWLVDQVEFAKPPRDYVADHARRTLRKAGLSKKDAHRVVEEIAKSKNFDLSRFSRTLPYSVSCIIESGFAWFTTPEGGQYWAYLAYEFHRKENMDAQAQQEVRTTLVP